MSFASSLPRLPIAFDPDGAGEVTDRFSGLSADLRALLTNTAACSPYLKSLMVREANWLEAALEDAAQAVEREIQSVALHDLSALGGALRQAKRRVALLVGLAELSGVWSLLEATGYLSAFADAALDAGLKALVAAEIERGRLPAQSGTAAGMVVLAMGKLGAKELNYSSDIDLICLFDESRYDPADYGEVRGACVRVTRKLTALMSEITSEGYVFRTDLRLRPDPSVTPVCLAMEAAERYYESLGRTWERAAHIKARPCAGDVEAGQAYLDRLRPFVWRRHLDFAAIEDAHAMRVAIRDHKKLYGQTLEGYDLKLGKGGIREIEFFTQTRQLIAGGRDPDLRERQTLGGLSALARKGWIASTDAQMLSDAYVDHRHVEHCLQMVQDAQTHQMPKDADGMRRIANLRGFKDAADFSAQLNARLEQVGQIAEGFFHPAPVAPQGAGHPDLEAHSVVQRWPNYPALRAERAVSIFKRIKPQLLNRLAQTSDPEEALIAFDGFFAKLPAGVQLFSLFQSNPDLLGLIVDIVSSAPALAQYLGRNAQVLDAVIGGDFFAPWPGSNSLEQTLTEQLEASGDYEDQLDIARRWTKEWHFRVGVHLLRGLITPGESRQQYADLAQAVIAAMMPVVSRDFARRHGPAPGRGAMILGMGALGGAAMSATSDLDLIIIYDAQGAEQSDGARPLPTRTYFARWTKAFITALSAPTAEGRLYEVDMRLRPSGRKGPVAVSLEGFAAYQKTEAWLWEHRALTRARGIAGETALIADVEQVRAEVLETAHSTDDILKDAKDMRQRLAQAHGDVVSALEPKLGAGRLQDIELFAQSCALVADETGRRVASQLAAGVPVGLITPAQAKALADIHEVFLSFQACLRLLGATPEKALQSGWDLVQRATQTSDVSALEQQMSENASCADEIISNVLKRLDTDPETD